MEAHGEFSDEEYQVVSFLREKEQVIDKLDSYLKNNKELIDDNEVGVYIAFRETMLK